MYRFILVIFALATWPGQAGANSSRLDASVSCYAQVFLAAETRTIREEVLVAPETYRREEVAAVYETVKEVVEVRPETRYFAEIPAVTETIIEEVLVEEARIEHRIIPARFETRFADTRRTNLFAPASHIGRDGGAVDQGFRKQAVMISPPRVEEVTIPARYERVSREVVVTPARMEEYIVPAAFEERETKVLVKPASVRYVRVPAQYETVERTVVVKPERHEWAEILCQSRADAYKIAELQSALTTAGYATDVDGLFGRNTARAIESFQKDQGLLVGYLTAETVHALGVDPYAPAPSTVLADHSGAARNTG